MHAYLIITSDIDIAQTKIQEILNNQKLIRRDWELNKISDVRQLEQFTKLSLSNPTAIVINNFENASIAAQNAFLKNLEEPQTNLKYIICSQTAGNILPTIHSRCEIIQLKSNKKYSDEILNIADDFIKGDYETRYKIITKLGNKREPAQKLAEAILHQSGILLKKGKLNHEFAEKAQNCLYAIQRNGNVGLQLINLAA